MQSLGWFIWGEGVLEVKESSAEIICPLQLPHRAEYHHKKDPEAVYSILQK